MATPTNTQTTYDTIGNREDLTDVIYNVDPTDTPYITSIGRTKATQPLHEWQTDTLSAAAANAVIEGDDATTDAVTATVRPSNTCQISDKVPRVTGTQQATVSAGRKDELAYQIVKRTKELRRDMEFILLQNTAEVTGNISTARQLGSIEAWYETNVSRGSGGTNGGSGNTAATDAGTARVFTESLLKNVIKSCWDNGGDPDCIMVGSFNKQKLSGFTGNATREISAQDRELVATIDLYHSDFGSMEVIPNRFQRARSAHVLQKDLWAVAYLRPVQMANLAKTGDSERRQIIAEYTLEARNEKGSGIVADLTTS